MNLWIEQPSRQRVAALDDPARVLAAIDRSNVLVSPVPEPPAAVFERVLCWSGTLAASLVESSPHNWTPRGRAAFDAYCDAVREPLTRTGRTILFQPHARHVLSDIPGCVRFVRERVHMGQPFGLALSPATMLTQRLVRNSLDDYLARVFETLGGDASVVVLYDIRPSPAAVPDDRDGDDAVPEVVPLGEGVLPRGLVRELLRAYVAPETPIVMMNVNVESQRGWLLGA